MQIHEDDGTVELCSGDDSSNDESFEALNDNGASKRQGPSTDGNKPDFNEEDVAKRKSPITDGNNRDLRPPKSPEDDNEDGEEEDNDNLKLLVVVPAVDLDLTKKKPKKSSKSTNIVVAPDEEAEEESSSQHVIETQKVDVLRSVPWMKKSRDPPPTRAKKDPPTQEEEEKESKEEAETQFIVAATSVDSNARDEEEKESKKEVEKQFIVAATSVDTNARDELDSFFPPVEAVTSTEAARDASRAPEGRMPERSRSDSPNYTAGPPKPESPKYTERRLQPKKETNSDKVAMEAEMKKEPNSEKNKKEHAKPEKKLDNSKKDLVDARESALSRQPELERRDSRELMLVTSEDFEGIDLDAVEKYEATFNEFLEQNPEFMERSPQMVEMLRVAKLQKLLSVIVQLESDLENRVQTLRTQKAESAKHYQQRMAKESEKKANKQIQQQQTLSIAQQATRLLKPKLTWQLISQCESLVKKEAKMQSDLLLQVAKADDPLALLPENTGKQGQAIRAEIEASREDNDAPVPVKHLQKLQVDNAFLKSEISVLTKKLEYLREHAQKHEWIDSVLRQLEPQQKLLLKKRYQKKSGETSV